MLGALLPVAVGMAALLYHIYSATLEEVEEVFDAELAQTAGMIADLVLADRDDSIEKTAIGISRKQIHHKYEKHIGYQVWHDGRLILRAQGTPLAPIADQPGFSTQTIDGRQWKVFGFYPENTGFRIYTAEDQKARKELSWKIILSSMRLILWSLPLLLVIIYILVNRALKPLEALSAGVRKQDINHLSPLDASRVPVEAAPVVNALNGLLTRLDRAMENERQFTANASHELRTPLSSIRLHSQLALNAPSEAEREESLRHIIEAVDQSTHLVEQLLLLGRMPAEARSGDYRAFRLGALCHEVAEKLQGTAMEKNMKLALEVEKDIRVKSNPQLLSAMLRNLLDNAIRYSPPGSRVSCQARKKEKLVEIVVTDEGPGIPEDRLRQARERFVRFAGQEVSGCGLGLSIVTMAAEYLGITFDLGNRTDGHSGLVARLVIPLQP